MLRKTDWEDLPLASIQSVPGKWITSEPNRDEAWTEVSEHLRPVLDGLKQRKQKSLEKTLKWGRIEAADVIHFM